MTSEKNFVRDSLNFHSKHQGKIEVISKVSIKDKADLSLAYTPGVAEPCKEIYREREMVYEYTTKGNMVAVVTDGSAVLGLGNIGPEAALPVMEGKAVLFKFFGGLDAFPICLNTQDADIIVETVKLLIPTFGGINLEDISAPRCFYIEERLKQETDVPVFHDDQHGTAVVVTAGLYNAVKMTGRDMESLKVVINGAGAAGTAITKLLLYLGVKRITICDSAGIIYPGRSRDMNPYKEELAGLTFPLGEHKNINEEQRTLKAALKNSDVFIGVSAPGVLTGEMVQLMAPKPIIFALANPIPEIMPQEALAAGCGVVATGRSDFTNQINNVLVFPGVLRGAMEVRAKDINNEMKVRAAKAIANLVTDQELSAGIIVPEVFDPRVAPNVAAAVAAAAVETGVAEREIKSREVYEKTQNMACSIGVGRDFLAKY
ncbi:NAD(P)-dependent malic enzyme [Candidatus Contubernalis alkaliaceticus]|uniref:NAD(P)-dependent malic enzyme n=1 Tax=Candidatus Contubernalis alkaliaceticus TaxID=338645 RepID=UPI001F4C3441|nr:malic enzyme-like NAD(P)-binding protein [Candidatus Contubernalis alkalaceticus]UNC92683.1 NAD-dependent malic enzyme [Candidatus Contubernalis alkalaceticus]